ncbi:MAG: hypothetical protein H7Y42_17300 [Chitinophagaceae bacterium]|nr:hypothetical protein [Chitinophagaceae bacterium]
MRIYLVFCLLSSIVVDAQRFNINVGGDQLDRALYITHTADGGYVACGYTGSFSSSIDAYLVKTDKAGNVQWQKNYGGHKMDLGWSVLEVKGKGYLLHGSTSSRRDTINQDIFLALIDYTGNLIWEKTYGNDHYERTTCVLETIGGDLLLIGQRTAPDKLNIDSYMIKLSRSGDIIWEKTFGGPHVERTFYGVETKQGDFLVTGLILPHGTDKADILLLKVSAAGQLLWTKTYGEKDKHDITHSFTRNGDGKTFTLTGYSESDSTGLHDGLFMQIDEEGVLLMSTRYHTGEDIRLMHSEETLDGGFIVTGYFRGDITRNIHDAILLKYSRNGIVQWRKNFGSVEADDQGYWVVVNKDGGYTIAGYTHSVGKGGDLWIIRTDEKGF